MADIIHCQQTHDPLFSPVVIELLLLTTVYYITGSGYAKDEVCFRGSNPVSAVKRVCLIRLQGFSIKS
ncbi:hypothetical protein D3C75_1120840 [compost metagenome]